VDLADLGVAGRRRAMSRPRGDATTAGARGRARGGARTAAARRAAAVATLVAAALAAAAGAHPLAPSLLVLREGPGGAVDARFATPRVAAGPPVRPVLPARCAPQDAARLVLEGSRAVVSQALDCGPAGLAGAEIGAERLDAGGQLVVRVERRDGAREELLLHADRPRAVLAARPRARDVALAYARLGAAHLAGGLDHLLFVAGLFGLVRGARSLAATLTAFTLGHGATLGLVAAGAPAPPAALVEPAIAASLVVLALELLDGGRGAPGALARRPLAMAAAFGLLHGLGFAGALREAGLPPASLALAVGAFHAGIEAAQLAFVLALAAAALALRGRLARARAAALGVAVGGLGALLLVERVAAWAAP